MSHSLITLNGLEKCTYILLKSDDMKNSSSHFQSRKLGQMTQLC